MRVWPNKLLKRNILNQKHKLGDLIIKEEETLFKLELNTSEIITGEERAKSHQFKKFCAQHGSVSLGDV